MRRINYKSDFDFILRLKDCADPDKTVPFPEGDFYIRFWTSSYVNYYAASCKNGEYVNCFRTEEGAMHFVFDNHKLGRGCLQWETRFELPNSLYPDGTQDIFRKATLDIELVDGDGDCPTTAEIEAMSPYIKGPQGDKLTFEDLTEQDKAELIAPIREDIDKALANKQLFCDLFNAAAGTYGYARFEDGDFDCELNKLKLTYEEAVAVYLDGAIDSLAIAGKWFRHRTNLPITATHAQGTIEQSFNSSFFEMNVEVANVATLNSTAYFSAYPISIYYHPFGFAKLKKIIGTIDFHFARAQINWFVGAVNLEEVRISRLAWSINLSSCSKLSLESFQYMIKEAWTDPGSNHSRVITVHPDVYAKLTDETNTEWHQVLLDAAEKNINFATT